MGLAMSVPQLLIILVIVALIFGTKRLKEVGGDLGSAVKSFRKAMSATGEADGSRRDAEAADAATKKRKAVISVPFRDPLGNGGPFRSTMQWLITHA